MPRYCLLGHVNPNRLEEYREAHSAVWPELLEALRDAGWRNYSLFLREDGLLVGYAEADDLARRAGTGSSHRGQCSLAGRHGRTVPDRGRSRRSLGDHSGGVQPRRSTSGCRSGHTSQPLKHLMRFVTVAG